MKNIKKHFKLLFISEMMKSSFFMKRLNMFSKNCIILKNTENQVGESITYKKIEDIISICEKFYKTSQKINPRKLGYQEGNNSLQ